MSHVFERPPPKLNGERRTEMTVFPVSHSHANCTADGRTDADGRRTRTSLSSAIEVRDRNGGGRQIEHVREADLIKGGGKYDVCTQRTMERAVSKKYSLKIS